MENPSHGCIKHFMYLLHGSLHVPAFDSAVWRGCRDMPTLHPRCQGVQTSPGIAGHCGWCMALITTCIPRAQGRQSCSLWVQSQARRAGCHLLLPTMGQSALEHREDVNAWQYFAPLLL